MTCNSALPFDPEAPEGGRLCVACDKPLPLPTGKRGRPLVYHLECKPKRATTRTGRWLGTVDGRVWLTAAVFVVTADPWLIAWAYRRLRELPSPGRLPVGRDDAMFDSFLPEAGGRVVWLGKDARTRAHDPAARRRDDGWCRHPEPWLCDHPDVRPGLYVGVTIVPDEPWRVLR